MKKNRVIYVIIAIIIIAGTINTFLNKFVFSLAYDSSTRLDIYVGKEYKEDEIKAIAKESLGTDKVLVQEIETFGDRVAILAKDISEDQQKDIVSKIAEKYDVEIKDENAVTTHVPHYDGRDLIRRYVFPIALSAILIIIYVAVRFKKLGAIKMISRTIAWSIIVELLYISIISLARIPVSFYTMPLGLILEILTLIILMHNFERELAVYKKENKKKRKTIEGKEESK